MSDRASIMAIQPRVKRARAGWMAITESGSSLRIGVQGRTEEEVRARFQEALEKWADLIYPKNTP